MMAAHGYPITDLRDRQVGETVSGGHNADL